MPIQTLTPVLSYPGLDITKDDIKILDYLAGHVGFNARVNFTRIAVQIEKFNQRADAKFPAQAYRVFQLDVAAMQSWSDFFKQLQGKHFESYARTAKAAKLFHKKETDSRYGEDTAYLVLRANVRPKEWVLDVVASYNYLRRLVQRTGLKVNNHIREDAFLKEFGSVPEELEDSLDEMGRFMFEEELIAVPGTLKAAFTRGDVTMVGNVQPGKNKIKWLEKASFQKAVASYDWSK